jgi:hypothetical protein
MTEFTISLADYRELIETAYNDALNSTLVSGRYAKAFR